MQAAVKSRLHWLVPLAAAWLWLCTVANQSAVQVLNFDNVENYALAVFCQLFWGFSETGEWAQTIHFGYVDSWMWSGHRTGWLPIVAGSPAVAEEQLHADCRRYNGRSRGDSLR